MFVRNVAVAMFEVLVTALMTLQVKEEDCSTLCPSAKNYSRTWKQWLMQTVGAKTSDVTG
jgi:hypothetical protein